MGKFEKNVSDMIKLFHIKELFFHGGVFVALYLFSIHILDRSFYLFGWTADMWYAFLWIPVLLLVIGGKLILARSLTIGNIIGIIVGQFLGDFIIRRNELRISEYTPVYEEWSLLGHRGIHIWLLTLFIFFLGGVVYSRIISNRSSIEYNEDFNRQQGEKMMEKKNKVAAGVLLMAVALIAVAMFIMGNQYDLRGFNLSDREGMLAHTGASHSFVFEVRAGEYKFYLYHYESGVLSSYHQFFPHGTTNSLNEALLFEDRRSYVGFTSALTDDHGLNWYLSTQGFNSRESFSFEQLNHRTRMWGSFSGRLNLENHKAPIAYLALSDGWIPAALQNLASGRFPLTEEIESISEVAHVFVIAVSRVIDE